MTGQPCRHRALQVGQLRTVRHFGGGGSPSPPPPPPPPPTAEDPAVAAARRRAISAAGRRRGQGYSRLTEQNRGQTALTGGGYAHLGGDSA